MKKQNFIIGVLIGFLIMVGCSSDDDNTSSSQIQINPPSWIQGKWLNESAISGEMGWRFTSNDFIIIQTGMELSQRGQIETFLNAGQEASASDESTDTTYKVISSFPGGQTTIYSFTKISPTEIEWDSATGLTYVKQ